MKRNKLYITIITTLFLALVVIFDTLPRSTYSKLENRDLALFPKFSLEDLKSGAFTSGISSWFSDTEPYRDVFMYMSMQVKDWISLNIGENNVKFHADKSAPKSEMPVDKGDDGFNPNANDIAKLATSGNIIVGEVPNVRALMCYGGDERGGVEWANAVNLVKDSLGARVNVYAMIVPIATEFYLPDNATKYSKPELPSIQNAYRHLKNVIPVDAHSALRAHTRENIYLRTDHHWSPLGAFYATREFARVAKVPFKELKDGYVQKVIPGFVGSMYHYTRDMSLKKSPEEFIYWEPIDSNYTVTTIDYRVDRNYHVVSESAPHKSKFFFHFPKRPAASYETFMGGDQFLVKVQTTLHTGRRLMIIKDSYGNVPPSYLFYSFDEIHVMDNRYFTKNLVKYVKENKITDLIFINNVYALYNPTLVSNLRRYLTQQDGDYKRRSASRKASPSKNNRAEKPAAKKSEAVSGEAPKPAAASESAPAPSPGQ